jgi:hypothetical protein
MDYCEHNVIPSQSTPDRCTSGSQHLQHVPQRQLHYDVPGMLLMPCLDHGHGDHPDATFEFPDGLLDLPYNEPGVDTVNLQSCQYHSGKIPAGHQAHRADHQQSMQQVPHDID